MTRQTIQQQYIDKIICGDALEVMAGMPDESVDLVVTDPPYGISFMGKAWDKALPSVDVWRECLRVLKPGAFAFVMCIPRQDCLSRMIINLEDAGFMVNFTPIYWTYATGFPKAANLSKLADKRAGVEREIVGKRFEGGMNRKNAINMKHGYRPNDYEKSPEINITAPATHEAKALAGAYAGFQPKPAVEVVIVAMKPCAEKTYLDQALSNGHGCTWLDDGRIPYEADDKMWGGNLGTGLAKNKFFTDGEQTVYMKQSHNAGRFAPNLLCSDDVLNDGRVTSNARPNCFGKKYKSSLVDGPIYGKYDHSVPYIDPNDSGSYSRYFSLDQWSAKHLPESVNRTFPFMIVPKASKSEKNAGLDDMKTERVANPNYGSGGFKRPTGEPEREISPAKNHHPTCKPVKLMSYLIAIGSRPGDVVLDPYAGSGTTGIAAALSDRKYILIELDAEYCEITERRIAWHVEQRGEDEERQLELPLR